MMTVKEIVIEYLKKNGYDGLYNDDCGCALDDLIPCCDNIETCMAGVKGKNGEEDWIIRPRVDKTPEEICKQLDCSGINDKCPGNPICPIIVFYQENKSECKIAADYMKKQIEKIRLTNKT